MTNPLEVIQPSLRYQREQRELEKVFVVDTPEGADGLGRVNLESGHIRIPVKAQSGDQAAPAAPSGDQAASPAPEPPRPATTTVDITGSVS
ncbi:MAG: DUF6191 domain-containing protein [Actinomycetia bacterium]|nr:DUF6191 domain-containing protein [Actinomycetes bacterium]